jgi:hypothetical protein
VALMSAGTTVALVFADHQTAQSYDLDAILALLDRPAVYVFLAIYAAVLAAMLVLVTRWTRIKPADMPPLLAAADAFARAFIAGLLGGLTGFLVKATVEVVFRSIERGNFSVFARWEPYAFVAALVAVLLNQGACRCSGSGSSSREAGALGATAVGDAACRGRCWIIIIAHAHAPLPHSFTLALAFATQSAT